jgi:predicted PurR-regulated permease PerM
MIPSYLGYHFIENYLIGPKMYGGRLRLSNVAVLVAFAIGAELGGVVGALLAMPARRPRKLLHSAIRPAAAARA